MWSTGCKVSGIINSTTRCRVTWQTDDKETLAWPGRITTILRQRPHSWIISLYSEPSLGLCLCPATFSIDFGMEFGLEECARCIIKNGKKADHEHYQISGTGLRIIKVDSHIMFHFKAIMPHVSHTCYLVNNNNDGTGERLKRSKVIIQATYMTAPSKSNDTSGRNLERKCSICRIMDPADCTLPL